MIGITIILAGIFVLSTITYPPPAGQTPDEGTVELCVLMGSVALMGIGLLISFPNILVAINQK